MTISSRIARASPAPSPYVLIHCPLGSKDCCDEGPRGWDCSSLMHSWGEWAEAWKGVEQLPPSLCTLPWYTLNNLPGHWVTSHGRPIPSARHTMLSFSTRASAGGSWLPLQTQITAFSIPKYPFFRRLRRRDIRPGVVDRDLLPLDPQAPASDP